jgi:hypothetical protein
MNKAIFIIGDGDGSLPWDWEGEEVYASCS